MENAPQDNRPCSVQNAPKNDALDSDQTRANFPAVFPDIITDPRGARLRTRKRPRVKRRVNKSTLSIAPLSQEKLRANLKTREKQKAFTSEDVEGESAQKRVSSWCASVAAHAVVVAVLAALFFPGKPSPPSLDANFSSEIGDQLDVLTRDEGNLNPTQAEEFDLVVPDDFKIEDVVVFEKEPLPFKNNVDAPEFEQSRVEKDEVLNGRTDPGLKNDLLAKYGGNKTTEDAVAAGLEWLAKQQQKDGSWSLNGPYANGVKGLDNRPAATALALLSFQGAGSTRSSGKYASVVRKGWLWLLKQQDKNGCFAPQKRVSEALFYTQALCALALCDLISLEKKANPALRKQAQSAIDYLLENQHAKLGGWRYAPQSGSDLSVTSWCLLALKTAEFAQLDVPRANFERIEAFLDSVSYDEGAAYVYRLDEHGKVLESDKRLSMTAAGLMCREYLGWTSEEPALLRGAKTLAERDNLPRFPVAEEEAKNYSHNMYGWYVASMALKGLGPYNKYWRQWNAALSSELPKRQEPNNSKEAGSWNPQYDEYAFGGGRLYVTCLAIMSLEVYYRRLAF